jgi:Ca2+-binding RTX toxin-like protein
LIAGALFAASLVTLAPSASAATPKCMGKKATKVGTPEADSITGTKKADVIVTKGGNDFVFGGGGNDLICLGPGNDLALSQAGRDKISGGTGDDTAHPGPGNDTYNGNGGDNWIGFLFATAGVTVNLNAGRATGEGSDTFSNVTNVTGSDFDDTITGTSATNLVLAGPGNDSVVTGATSTNGDADQTDIVDGGDGNDSVDGGDGFDMISFQSLEGPTADACDPGIDVDLSQGSASGQGTDTFQSMEAAWGSNENDVIRGSSASNFLVGALCDDDIRGLGNFDYAIYWFAEGAVQASLASGTATGEGTDTLANDVEGLFGSILGNDTLTGDNKDNYLGGDLGNDTLDGGGGDDWLNGGGGNDSLEGGAGGYDLADFSTSFSAVNANLVNNTATGDGNDTLANLEALYGSIFADALTGNDSDNFLFGDFGSDQLTGGLGKDEIDGGPDSDGADGGGGGNDECANVEQVSQCTAVAATEIRAHPLLTAAQAVADFRRNF